MRDKNLFYIFGFYVPIIAILSPIFAREIQKKFQKSEEKDLN